MNSPEESNQHPQDSEIKSQNASTMAYQPLQWCLGSVYAHLNRRYVGWSVNQGFKTSKRQGLTDIIDIFSRLVARRSLNEEVVLR